MDQEIENLIVRLQAEVDDYRKAMENAADNASAVDTSVQRVNKTLESTKSISERAASAVEGITSTLIGLDAKFKAVGGSLQRFGGEFVKLGGIVASTLGADIIIDSTGQMISWAAEGAKGARSTAIALERLTRDTNLSVEEMSALKWYSDQTGVSLETLTKNLSKMPDSVKRWAGSAAASNLLMTSAEVKAAKTFSDSLNLLVRTVQRIGQVASSAIFPVLTEWASRLQKVAAGVLEFVSQNKALIRTIFEYAAKVAAFGGAIALVGKLISQFGGVFSLLATVISLVGGTLGTLLSVFLALPTPILLLLAVGAGVVAMFTDWRSKIPSSLEEVKAGFFSLLDSAKRVLEQLWSEVNSSFSAITNALRAGDLAAAGKVAWALIYLEWVKGTNALKEVWVGVKDYFRSVWEDLPTWFVDLWESPITSIKELFAIAFAWVKVQAASLGQVIAQSILGAVSSVVNKISNALAGSTVAELSGLRGAVLGIGTSVAAGTGALKAQSDSLLGPAKEEYEKAQDSRNRRLSEREAARANGVVSEQEKEAQKAKRALKDNFAEVNARKALEDAQAAANAASPKTAIPKLAFKPEDETAKSSSAASHMAQKVDALEIGSSNTAFELMKYRFGRLSKEAKKGTGPWVAPPSTKEDKTLDKLGSINDGIKSLVEAAERQAQKDALDTGDISLSGADLA